LAEHLVQVVRAVVVMVQRETQAAQQMELPIQVVVVVVTAQTVQLIQAQAVQVL
jgi:ribosomal protein L13E